MTRYTTYFKNEVLSQTFKDYSKTLVGNYKKFETTVKKSTAWWIPNPVLNQQRDKMRNVFSQIDNTPSSMSSARGNDTLELEEIYNWVRAVYKKAMGTEISKENLEKMKMGEIVDLIQDKEIDVFS